MRKILALMRWDGYCNGATLGPMQGHHLNLNVPQSSATNTWFSWALWREQVCQFDNLVAAQCKSHQNPECVRTNGMHTHTHKTTQWMSTQRQESKDITRRVNEQESQSPQSPYARPCESPSQTIQFLDASLFSALYQSQSLTQHKGPRRRLIGTCTRCRPLKNVTPNGKRHTRSKKKEYLVLQKDYSIDDASWTLESNFDYPKELKKMIERDQPIEGKSNP